MLDSASAAGHPLLHSSALSNLQAAASHKQLLVLELPSGDGATWRQHALASAHDVGYLYAHLCDLILKPVIPPPCVAHTWPLIAPSFGILSSAVVQPFVVCVRYRYNTARRPSRAPGARCRRLCYESALNALIVATESVYSTLR